MIEKSLQTNSLISQISSVAADQNGKRMMPLANPPTTTLANPSNLNLNNTTNSAVKTASSLSGSALQSSSALQQASHQPPPLSIDKAIGGGGGGGGAPLKAKNATEKSSIASLENISGSNSIISCSASTSPTVLLTDLDLQLPSVGPSGGGLSGGGGGIGIKASATNSLPSTKFSKPQLSLQKPAGHAPPPPSQLSIPKLSSSSGPTSAPASATSLLTASATADSPIYSYISPTVQTSTHLVEQNISKGKIKTLSPQHLLDVLSEEGARDTTTRSGKGVEEQESISLSPPPNLLILDMRDQSLYIKSRLKGSLHVQFPALVIKRFRKRLGLASFQLLHFLEEEGQGDARRLYSEWRGIGGIKAKKCLVVFDEEMESTSSDAFAFLGVVSEGGGGLVLGNGGEGDNLTVWAVEGGYKGIMGQLRSHPDKYGGLFVEERDEEEGGGAGTMINGALAAGGKSSLRKSSSSKDLEKFGRDGNETTNGGSSGGGEGREEDGTLARSATFSIQRNRDSSADSATTTSSSSQTPASSISTTISAQFKNTRSLSVDIISRKESPSRKMGALKLSTKPTALNPSLQNSENKSPLSTHSPNDMAAPPEPYSFITSRLLVGSDMLPSSPSAPTLLKEIGVTHILNMAAEIPLNPKCEGQFTLKWIPVYDNTEVDMDDALQTAIAFIGKTNYFKPCLTSLTFFLFDHYCYRWRHFPI